jgi:tetratricopeptide (TPR) repeat protein
MERLAELDVSDSMKRNIEILDSAIGSITASNVDEAREMFEAIHKKVTEIEDYFDRPVDSLGLYEKLVRLAKDMDDEKKATLYEFQINLFRANDLEFMGRVQDFYGNKVRALEYYSRALELVPDHELAFPSHGRVLNSIDKARRELDVSQRKLQSKPEDAGLWFRYGTALLNLGEVDGAIKAFDKVIEFEPSNADALARRGTAMESLGQYAEARIYLERALEVKPNSMTAKRGLNFAEYFLERV